MDKEIITLINQLLKIAYEFGWEVGASHDMNYYKDLVDPSGYLNHDGKIEQKLDEALSQLLCKFGDNPDDYIIYTKEDISYKDWDYIAPLIEKRKK